MWIRTAHIRNFKSILDSGVVNLGKVTVLVGANNSGKSAFIQALYSLQVGAPNPTSSIRVGATGFTVELTALDAGDNPWNAELPSGTAEILLSFDRGRLEVSINRNHHTGQIAQQEPAAFFYPQLGKRKVAAYGRNVDLASTRTILPSWQNLVSRLQPLSNPDFPGSDEYREACRSILGFVVTVFPSEHGQQAGRYLDREATIPIEEMGEGVSAVVGLLVDLASARGRVFLIEEPENDLHPLALKRLLDLLLLAADHNQIIATTHSNLVLKHLGSHQDAVVLKVSCDLDRSPPESAFIQIPNDPPSRLELLRELGYELADFELFDAWLILEESSAERLIRQYFVKWYTPSLVGRLRTIAAAGTGNVEPTFADFSSLFLYAHLQPHYAGRAWVVVDGDESGRRAVERLRSRFELTWDPRTFRFFSVEDFEEYYPPRFHPDIAALKATPTGRIRQAKKTELLEKVISWIEYDEKAAMAEFRSSAAEPIEVLRDIESVVLGAAT